MIFVGSMGQPTAGLSIVPLPLLDCQISYRTLFNRLLQAPLWCCRLLLFFIGGLAPPLTAKKSSQSAKDRCSRLSKTGDVSKLVKIKAKNACPISLFKTGKAKRRVSFQQQIIH